jgi:hypothetical protein
MLISRAWVDQGVGTSDLDWTTVYEVTVIFLSNAAPDGNLFVPRSDPDRPTTKARFLKDRSHAFQTEAKFQFGPVLVSRQILYLASKTKTDGASILSRCFSWIAWQRDSIKDGFLTSAPRRGRKMTTASWRFSGDFGYAIS